MNAELAQLLIALLTGILFTFIPLYISYRRNKGLDKTKEQERQQALQDLHDQEEYQNLLEKSKVVDERLDSYIERIEQENKRLRAENHILDAKLDGMRELLIDCKEKLRVAQTLLERFQERNNE